MLQTTNKRKIFKNSNNNFVCVNNGFCFYYLPSHNLTIFWRALLYRNYSCYTERLLNWEWLRFYFHFVVLVLLKKARNFFLMCRLLTKMLCDVCWGPATNLTGKGPWNCVFRFGIVVVALFFFYYNLMLFWYVSPIIKVVLHSIVVFF